MSASSPSRPNDPGGGAKGTAALGEVGVALGSGADDAPNASHSNGSSTPPAAHAASTTTLDGDQEETPAAPATAPDIKEAPSQAWSFDGAARLRASLAGKPQPTPGDDSIPPPTTPGATGTVGPYAANYACASKPTNLIPDGYQRQMTELEHQTTLLWATGKIFLPTVPKFFMATMTTDEYAALADYHKKHLLYRLYIRLPRGFMLPNYDANRQFWSLLQKGAQLSGYPRATEHVNALFADHHTTTCEARFQMVTLTFLTPTLRNKWKNRVFSFMSKNVKIVLKASDTLSVKEPTVGYDEGARQLQYSVLLLGLQSRTHQEVLALARAVGGQHPISVEEIPPVGDAFAPHFWKLTYDSLSCPRELVNVRRLQVRQEETTYTAFVHHHLSTYRFPCGNCLSVLHSTKDCTASDKAAAAAPHTLEINVTPTDPSIVGQRIRHGKDLRDRLLSLRKLLAPDVLQRHEREEHERRSKQEKADGKKRKPTDTEAKDEHTTATEGSTAVPLTAAERRELHNKARAAVEAMASAKHQRHAAQEQAEKELHRPRSNGSGKSGGARRTPLVSPRRTNIGDTDRRTGDVNTTPGTQADTSAEDGPDTSDTTGSPPPHKGQDGDNDSQQAATAGPSTHTEQTDSVDVDMESRPSSATARETKPTTSTEPTDTDKESNPSTGAPDSASATPANQERDKDTRDDTVGQDARVASAVGQLGDDTNQEARSGPPRGRTNKPLLTIDTTWHHLNRDAPQAEQKTDARTAAPGKQSRPSSHRASVKQRGTPRSSASAPSSTRPRSAGHAAALRRRWEQRGTVRLSFVPLSMTFARTRQATRTPNTPVPRTRSSDDDQDTKQETDTPPHARQAGETGPSREGRQADPTVPAASAASNGMTSDNMQHAGPEAASARSISPRKRERQATAGDSPRSRNRVAGTKAAKTHPAGSPKKSSIRPARVDTDSDDFEPDHSQPKLASLRMRHDTAPDEKPTTQRPTVQAAVTEFLVTGRPSPQTEDQPSSPEVQVVEGPQRHRQPASPGSDGMASYDSDIADELVATQGQAPQGISAIQDWLRIFDARLVDNQRDGRCLYQALDGALRTHLHGNTMGKSAFAVKEAHTLKQISCTYLLHYLPQMVDDGTVDIDQLHARYYDVFETDTPTRDKYAEIVAHVWETYDYPAGAALPPDRWSGAEEIFGLVWYLREPIFIIGEDGHAQIYLIEQAEAQHDYDERISIVLATNAVSWTILQTLINHQVIPKVLVHTGHADNGHFQTLRFPAAWYKDWIPTPEAGADTMQDRLRVALIKLGHYAPGRRPPLPWPTRSDVVETPSQLSGSLYSGSSDDEATSHPASAHPTDEQLAVLLDQLNPHQRLRSDERLIWRATERANLAALRSLSLPGATPADRIETIAPMAEAFLRRIEDPETATSFLRALPYPLVSLVSLPAKAVTRLGQELTMIGRRSLLQHWGEALGSTQAEAIQSLLTLPAGTTEQRWKQAQETTRWTSLTEVLGKDLQQHRSLPASDEDQVLKMLVALVISLPDATLAEQCAAVHHWISTSAADARQLLTEIRCHQWTRVARIRDIIRATTSPLSAPDIGHWEASRRSSNQADIAPPEPRLIPQPQGHSQDIRLHFKTTTRRQYQKQIHKAFAVHQLQRRRKLGSTHRKKRRKKQHLAAHGDSCLLRTQNVRGIGGDNAQAEAWFDVLRAQDGAEAPAITFLQETHADQGAIRELSDRYRGGWGFNTLAATMSFWAASDGVKGGVAVLLNPYKIKHAEPVMTERWSPHFMAVTARIDDQEVMLINVYAPSSAPAREEFFRSLAHTPRPETTHVVIGGDFNCTQHADLDRTYKPAASAHVSTWLDEWIAQWRLSDALAAFFPDEDASQIELAAFQTRTHTYQYKVKDTLASSRLDRWYVSEAYQHWVHEVATVDMGCGADHAAVTLRLLDPTHPRVTRRPARIYPPRPGAAHATHGCVLRHIAEVEATFATLDTDAAQGHQYTEAWDRFKLLLAQDIRRTQRQATATINSSYKRKIGRYRRRLRTPGLQIDKKQELETRLQTTVDLWRHLKRRRRMAQQSASGPAATKAFFDRAALPRAATVVKAIRSTAGTPPRAEWDLANRMADGWREVFTQPATGPVPIRYSAPKGESLTQDDAAVIKAEVTQAEIRRSIRRCKRTKSAGPDQLPNAWYRDYAEELTPILHRLLGICYDQGCTPSSFQTATVVCLPKGGQTDDPLGYRPIALLNTDYKIYMRILADRIKPILPRVIADSQAGFVAGRDIHDTIDLFTAAQHHATRYNTETLAILLDVRKAYDSLNRAYLERCLEHRGFPSNFINAIRAAHSDTSGRFRVNGVLSSPVAMTRGIRQGCPLAPLLFILALDPLYRELQTDQDLQDPLGQAAPGFPICAGYADDTALYCRDESAIPVVAQHLKEFELASGLQVNMDKSLAFRLNPTGAPPADNIGFQRPSRGTSCRYLGIQAGQCVEEDAVWRLTRDQIRTRLAMASIKTHTVRQRVLLARAIALPKILYVARHHWPRVAWIKRMEQCIVNFAWHGRFSETVTEGIGGPRWMNTHLARLPPGAGGLGVPDLTVELQTMAASVMERWAYNPTGIRDTAMRTREQNEPIQPRLYLTSPQQVPTIKADLWRTGRAAAEWVHSSTMDFPTQILIRDAIAALAGDNRWRWWRGEYERDYAEFHDIGGKEIMRLREQTGGRLAPEWVPWIRITRQNTPIITQAGHLLTQQDVNHLGRGPRLSDYVTWTWVSRRTLRFKPALPFPLSNQAAMQFRRLCDTVVANFPDITRRPEPTGLIRPYNIAPTARTSWLWDAGTLTCYHDGDARTRSPVDSQFTLQRQPPIRTTAGMVRPRFECTPLLTRLVSAWRGDRPWRPSRRKLLKTIGQRIQDKGLAARDKREKRWREADTEIADAVLSTPWHDFNRPNGLHPTEVQLWTRIRHHQIHVWPTPDRHDGCRRNGCSHARNPTTAHIFWTCPAAQQHWQAVARLWQMQQPDADSLRTAVFGLHPPDSSYDWRAGHPDRGSHVEDRLLLWLDKAWRLLVTISVQQLWHRAIEDSPAVADTDEPPGDPRKDRNKDYYVVLHRWCHGADGFFPKCDSAT